MVMLRRYLSRFLALVAAVALIDGSFHGAQTGTEFVGQFLVYNPGFVTSELRDTITLVAVALVTGTCAIVIAPHPERRVYTIDHDTRRMGARGYTIHASGPSPHSSASMRYAQGHLRDDRQAPRKSHAPGQTTSKTTHREHTS